MDKSKNLIKMNSVQLNYDTADVIRGLYRGFLDREPDKAGLQYWVTQMQSGVDVQTVLRGIMYGPEYSQKIIVDSETEDVKRSVAKYALTFLDANPLIIVDVGAQELHDEEHIYSAINKYAIPKKIIGFEPIEERRLDRLRKERDDDVELLPTFVGDGKNHTFYINNPDSTSSLLPLNQKITEQFIGLREITINRTEIVTTKTLDEALINCPYIDFLKLDIQGFELPVLLNSINVLKRTQIIHCEVFFFEIYKEQSLFSDIEKFLRNYGFSFIDFSHSCRYPYKNLSNFNTADRLGWGDAIFIRDSSNNSTERDAFVQSLIALFFYEKLSLASSIASRCSANLSMLFNRKSE